MPCPLWLLPISATMLPKWMPAPVVSGGYLEGNAGK